MEPTLDTIIRGYSDDFLLEQYCRKKHQYTPQALELMESEIARRNIPADRLGTATDHGEQVIAVDKQNQTRDEFVPLHSLFTITDLPLLQSMLAAHDIPVMAEPVRIGDETTAESMGGKAVRVLVHRDLVAATKQIILEHFEESQGLYLIKFSDMRDRLKAFDFSAVPFTEKEHAEIIDVSFSADELAEIVVLARRLLDEAESIEAQQERFLFYYDHIEPLIDKLRKSKNPEPTCADLLTILEVLQTYCSDAAFPHCLDETARSLLNFFTQH